MEPDHPYGFKKRFILMLMGVLLSCSPAWAGQAGGYARLWEYLQSEPLDAPLTLLADTQGEFDPTLNQENLNYLNQNKALLQSLQQRLAADSLKWRLVGSSKRLLVVLEKRQEYAELFQKYCREAVAYALRRTHLPNPYQRIEVLKEPAELQEDGLMEGISAYLVHNIADEYVEEYLFFNQEAAQDRQATGQSKIKIKLSNRVFAGRIGSYTSRLTILKDKLVEFVRDPYTIWQDNAKNPINALVAPVEETLHIALRPATEAAIRTQLQAADFQSLQEVQEVVDEWMAVEEAIVGGLVSRLMPEIFTKLMAEPLENEMNSSLVDRASQTQYRYLQRGIRIVSHLGLNQAVALYTCEPSQFREMIN